MRISGWQPSAPLLPSRLNRHLWSLSLYIPLRPYHIHCSPPFAILVCTCDNCAQCQEPVEYGAKTLPFIVPPCWLPCTQPFAAPPAILLWSLHLYIYICIRISISTAAPLSSRQPPVRIVLPFAAPPAVLLWSISLSIHLHPYPDPRQTDELLWVNSLCSGTWASFV